MVPLPGLHLWTHLIVIFDLLTPKVDRFISLLREPFVPIIIKIGSYVVRISCSQVW